MKGRLTVESREEFDEWLKQKYAEQQAHAGQRRRCRPTKSRGHAMQ